MGYFYHSNVIWGAEPQFPPNTRLDFAAHAATLAHFGLNLPISVSSASLYSPKDGKERNAPTIGVMAHLDTGASVTVISVDLAKYLKLNPTGAVPVVTAGGIHKMATFVVDLHFPSCNLSSIINLPVSSCYLDYNVSDQSLNERGKFAVLIGRDVMSRWNIVWNGPTSTVIIND
jgi:hypothetical protein